MRRQGWRRGYLISFRRRRVEADLKQLQQSILSAVEGMSGGDLARSRNGKWSVAQILEHLYLTYRGTTKGFEKCLKAEKPLGGKRSVTQRIAATAVTRFGYLPEGRNAPEPTVPRGMPVDKVLEETLSGLAAMDAIISEAERKYGKRACVLDHPVLGPLTTKQWRGFHCTHGQHHLKQIRNLRAVS